MIPNLDAVYADIAALERRHHVRLCGCQVRPVAATKKELIHKFDEELLELCEWYGLVMQGDYVVGLAPDGKALMTASAWRGAAIVEENKTALLEQFGAEVYVDMERGIGRA